MTHSIKHQIALNVRIKPRSRIWKTLYRMHTAGIDNMIKDAREMLGRDYHEYKVTLEEVRTGATVAILQRETAGRPRKPDDWNLIPVWIETLSA